MKRNLLPLAALILACAVVFLAVGVWLFLPSMPLSDLPVVPVCLPRLHLP